MKIVMQKIVRDIKRNKFVYLLFLPALVIYLIFNYAPMAGSIIAFQDYFPRKGFLQSEWVGLKHFFDFFNDMYFWRLIRNTLMINIYDIIIGFPIPIILALMLNELKQKKFRGYVQTTLYMPNFISSVVLCGIIIDFCSSEGLVSQLFASIGLDMGNLLQHEALFKPIFIVSNIWQFAGWSSIIYVAALSGINQELYDAAQIDGCNRFKQIIHVTIPGIMPTIIIMLILRMGNLMSVGFEKIIILYNPLTYETADVISSYVYRRGILEANNSYATAVGLFNSVLNFGFLWLTNAFSRKVSEQSLW